VFVRRLRTRVETSSGIALEYGATHTDAEVCFIARFGDKVAEHTARPHARRLRDLDPQALVLMGALHARGIAQAGPAPHHSGPVVLGRGSTRLHEARVPAALLALLRPGDIRKDVALRPGQAGIRRQTPGR